MDESQFDKATKEDREERIVRPYDDVPLTELVPGSLSHLVQGENVTISFLTMKSGSTFELHSHPEEQIMIVVDGYCDEIIEGKIYRVEEGDVIFLPSGTEHGAFIRDVDCKAIDIFSPPRDDYREKFLEQNESSEFKFKP